MGVLQFSWPAAFADIGDDVSQLAAFLAYDNSNPFSFLFESYASDTFNPANGQRLLTLSVSTEATFRDGVLVN
jgi:hypothetical protein